MKNFIIYGFILILIFTACNAHMDEKNKDKIALQGLRMRLDSLFNSNYKKNEPGIAVLIIYDTLEIFKNGYGVRDINTQAPITPSTNMRSASFAKQFTALGILSLIDQNKISLNDTVFKYLNYPIFRNITIKQLLGHTSGILDAESVLTDQWDGKQPITNQEVISWYSINDSVEAQPGTTYHYNNGAYYVLTRIIELQSNMAFEEYIKKYVFDVAEMPNTQFVDYPYLEKIEERANCYERDSLGYWSFRGEKEFKDQAGLALIGAGGMYTNLNDFENYIKALRLKNIVSDTSHDLMFKPISPANEPVLFNFEQNQTKQYAMGLWVHEGFALGAGSDFGVTNWCYYDFTKPLTIVFFSNNNLMWENQVMNETYNLVNEYLNTIANN